MPRQTKTETVENFEAAVEVVVAEIVEQPKVIKSYQVLAIDRTGLPNFPSSRESAARDLENYLETKLAEGYTLAGVIDRQIGVQPVKLLVFKAI